MGYQLTVITPVYNISEHLPRFFESMSRQTFRDFRLLLLDDGSQDDSLKVCRDFAEKDSRVTVVASEHMGVTAIKTKALEYIETPFTAYADGDDYVEPDYLMHLMDAQKKYDADLVISRVQYQLENGAIEGAFPERGEMLITRDEFKEKIPLLLDDRRLNYLYAKVYRSSLLTDIRIPDDVRQGSDTMTNFTFIKNASTIVLIDDLDYHYTRYSIRSVTSYNGEESFNRINRINRFVYDSCKETGLLTEEMLSVIDKRVLLSAVWSSEKIMASDIGDDVKARRITEMLHDDFYLSSYERQQKRTTAPGFEIIQPQDGAVFLKNKQKAEEKQKRKAQILSKTPRFVVNLYHKLKGVPSEG